MLAYRRFDCQIAVLVVVGGILFANCNCAYYKTFKVQRRMLNQASHHTIYLHLQKSTPGTTVQLVEMPPSIC